MMQDWLQRYLMSGRRVVNQLAYELLEPVRPGRVICTVEMRGCMAETRHNERWGTIKDVEVKKLVTYPAGYPVRMALVRYYLTGQEEWIVASEIRDRGEYLEYQY